MNLNSHVHEYETFRRIKPSMVYDGSVSLPVWQEKARATLASLLGLPFERAGGAPNVEYTIDFDTHTETRFTFESEPGYFVPCHLLIPRGLKPPIPLTLCQSGHGGGMHIALGRVKRAQDEETLRAWPHRAMAMRAIQDGRCALVIEARNFGECSLEGYGTSCTESAKIALVAGRTALGGRVWDTQRALDVVERSFPEVDVRDVVCTGNSGGGTTTYYAACLDERITVAAPSCAVCTFEDSIAAMPHCMCNHVPGIRRYFEMGDMAAMIAPRRLIVAAGMRDRDFPIFGVKKAFAQIKRAYALAGCPGHCTLVIGALGHLNYADLIWEAIGKPVE